MTEQEMWDRRLNSGFESALAPLFTDTDFRKDLSEIYAKWSETYNFLRSALLWGTITLEEGKWRAASQEERKTFQQSFEAMRRDGRRRHKAREREQMVESIADGSVKPRLAELIESSLQRCYGLLPPLHVGRLEDEILCEFRNVDEDDLEEPYATGEVLHFIDSWFGGANDDDRETILDFDLTTENIYSEVTQARPKKKPQTMSLKGARAKIQLWETKEDMLLNGKAHAQLSLMGKLTARVHHSISAETSKQFFNCFRRIMKLLRCASPVPLPWREHSGLLCDLLEIATGEESRLDSLSRRLRHSILTFVLIDDMPRLVKLPMLFLCIESIIGVNKHNKELGKNEPITKTVARRVATLLEEQAERRNDCATLVERLYHARSRCMHGDAGFIKREDVETLQGLFAATLFSTLSVRRLYSQSGKQSRNELADDLDQVASKRSPFLTAFKTNAHRHWRELPRSET